MVIGLEVLRSDSLLVQESKVEWYSVAVAGELLFQGSLVGWLAAGEVGHSEGVRDREVVQLCMSVCRACSSSTDWSLLVCE